MAKQFIFEQDDCIYLVGPAAPEILTDAEIGEFSFAEGIRSSAPNENILWLKGDYVQGNKANDNGQLWETSDLQIKSLTPRLMPVTVMHDLRTAVGLIADAKLKLPDTDHVEHPTISTALAIWAHRFPDIAEEIAFNHKQGTLMQSQECFAKTYSCVECNKQFHPLPRHAERDEWCSHLRNGGPNGRPIRRLEDVTFTGTGLIFGSRGAQGALDTAHLETFQSQVAELHQKAHHDAEHPKSKSRRRASVETIEINRSEYDELKAKANKADELTSEVSSLQATAEKVPDLEKQIETLEIEKKAAETARDTEKAEKEKLQEASRATELSADRTSKLGAGFIAKLPDTVKTKLTEQAKSLSDEDWQARLDELAELVGVKSDEKGEEGAEGATTPAGTETSRTQFGSGSSGDAGAPKQVKGALGGLFTRTPAKSAEK